MTIQTVPFSALSAPQANPRKQIDPAAIEGLAASIRADGVLQNLVVQPVGGKRRGKRRFQIITGERRYRALSLLRERKEIAADYPVPVEVREKVTAEDAHRIATVENVQREALAPMDEAEAFAVMAQQGATIEDIAAKVGFSESTIKRRLALANLCEEAKEAVRSGALTLSVAEAFTLGSHEQQQELLGMMDEWELDAEHIRHRLTGEKPSVALAIFPLEGYSGTFTSDLFGEAESTFFDDPEQFFALQQQAVAELAEAKRQEAAWVEITHGSSLPSWHYRQAEHGEAGGVVINLSPMGRVEVREGLVKHDLAPGVAVATERPAVAAEPEQPRPEYSGALLRYIAAHKTMAVQAALLANPRKAKEVAVVQMMRTISGQNVTLKAHDALSFFAHGECTSRAYDEIEAVAGPLADYFGERQEKGEGNRPAGWADLLTTYRSDVTTYMEVAELDDESLDRLHVLLTVLTFGQNNMERLDAERSLFNRVAEDLQVDMRQWWRPDAAFLSRRSLPQLHKLTVECGANYKIGQFSRLKKGELVKELERYFVQTAKMESPDEIDALGKDWLPHAMLFPAVEPGATVEEKGDDAEAPAECECEHAGDDDTLETAA